MYSLMFAPENLPFAVALLVMLGIGLLEALATALGTGLSHVLDSYVEPHTGLHHDFHVDGGSSAFGRVLDWFHIGRVPVLAVLVVFLLCFGLTGLVLQGLVRSITGNLVPGWAAGVGVFFLVLPLVRRLVGALARIMPKDETTAVRRSSFVGRLAVVTTGRAERGKPAPARLRDANGQLQYVLVEPDDAEGPLDTGAEVILISHSGAVFRAIKNSATAPAESA